MNREDFPLLKTGIIYFDNGATSLKPKAVLNSMNDYYENYDIMLSLMKNHTIEETMMLPIKLVKYMNKHEKFVGTLLEQQVKMRLFLQVVQLIV